MTRETDPPLEEPGDEPPLSAEELEELEQLQRLQERPLFQHPQWMVGIVMIFAFITLYAGIYGDPVWLLIGSPFIVTLAIYLWARFFHRP